MQYSRTIFLKTGEKGDCGHGSRRQSSPTGQTGGCGSERGEKKESLLEGGGRSFIGRGGTSGMGNGWEKNTAL